MTYSEVTIEHSTLFMGVPSDVCLSYESKYSHCTAGELFTHRDSNV